MVLRSSGLKKVHDRRLIWDTKEEYVMENDPGYIRLNVKEESEFVAFVLIRTLRMHSRSQQPGTMQ